MLLLSRKFEQYLPRTLINSPTRQMNLPSAPLSSLAAPTTSSPPCHTMSLSLTMNVRLSRKSALNEQSLWCLQLLKVLLQHHPPSRPMIRHCLHLQLATPRRRQKDAEDGQASKLHRLRRHLPPELPTLLKLPTLLRPHLLCLPFQLNRQPARLFHCLVVHLPTLTRPNRAQSANLMSTLRASSTMTCLQTSHCRRALASNSKRRRSLPRQLNRQTR